MINAATLLFLKELKTNNNKPWFEAHRKQYEAAKSNMLNLADDLIKSIGTFDAPIGQLTAKNCLFRINRDVRFSKDKSPYKSNMACYFNGHGKNGKGGGYYVHIEPGNSMAGGGIWMPEAPVLAGIRQEIDYNLDAWMKIVQHKTFKQKFPEGVKTNDMLVRPPKGYDENNPAIGFLKMKSFVVTKPLSNKDLRDKNLVKELSGTFKAMKPFLDFLNSSLH